MSNLGKLPICRPKLYIQTSATARLFYGGFPHLHDEPTATITAHWVMYNVYVTPGLV